ncbi:MAG: amidohydrolase family protein [Actinoallomurus sp.]
MTSGHVNAVLLPAGDSFVGGIGPEGRWAPEPPAGAERLPGRYVLPGLVDAHCHLSVGRDADGGPAPLTVEETRANLAAAGAAGITVIRDVGSPGSITLTLPAGGEGVRLLASGRFLAPENQYFPALHVPVPPEALVDAALAEISAGARWVKLVGDFPVLGQAERTEALPTYAIDEVRRLVEAVHAAGARVAVHTNTAFVKELVAAGVDSVEHGDGLDEDDLAALAVRGGAWTPTLCAGILPRAGDDSERRRRRSRRRERLGYLLPVAADLGVTIMAGTDISGSIAREVTLMTELGLTPEVALAAASTAAHDFLGVGGLGAGELVDLVSYHDDPREDPSVLGAPAAIIVQGVRVR